MFDIYPSTDDPTLIAAVIIDLVQRIGYAPLLYLAAAAMARFWHRHMWLIYLGFALAAILAPHH